MTMNAQGKLLRTMQSITTTSEKLPLALQGSPRPPLARQSKRPFASITQCKSTATTFLKPSPPGALPSAARFYFTHP